MKSVSVLAIPIGFKLSANRYEQDIDFALDAGADYIILDSRGGGTGAARLIFQTSNEQTSGILAISLNRISI